jgi:predicted esterase
VRSRRGAGPGVAGDRSRALRLATRLLSAGLSAGRLALADGADPLPVAYQAAEPAIDGLPETAPVLAPVPLPLLPGQPGRPDPEPTLRVAWGANHLYLLVELEAERLERRDRAYQNGDGLIVVVARPRDDGAPAEEFRVLGFSAPPVAARWQQQFTWYRDVELEMRALEETRLATHVAGGRAFFEISIPWRELYPFHPWFSEALGLNVCVTRALPGQESARYCLVEDRRVDSEQSPRASRPLAFAAARPGDTLRADAVLDRNTVRAGESPRLRLATLAAAAASSVATLRVLSGEGTRLAARQESLALATGLGRQELEVPAADLPPGGYAVTWELADGSAAGRFGLTVLPAADAGELLARMRRVAGRLRPGSVTTLEHRLEEIRGLEARRRPQDVTAALRVALEETESDLRDAEAGVDAVAARTGTLRRAFRSALDRTLQPYSVRIPEGYDPGRRYPLLVFLHGSGQDDRGQLGRDGLPRDLILLAPRARGTSNWYSADHAQEDIREAIRDVGANYSIDESRILLAGFSMGGYGVYRTFLESPDLFRALAVFSGIPRVPGGPAGAPDFLDLPDLAPFQSMPLFVFHGDRDRNCPVEQTRALVERLRRAGAQVTYVEEPGKGHEAPGADATAAFRAWLRSVLGD